MTSAKTANPRNMTSSWPRREKTLWKPWGRRNRRSAPLRRRHGPWSYSQGAAQWLLSGTMDWKKQLLKHIQVGQPSHYDSAGHYCDRHHDSWLYPDLNSHVLISGYPRIQGCQIPSAPPQPRQSVTTASVLRNLHTVANPTTRPLNTALALARIWTTSVPTSVGTDAGRIVAMLDSHKSDWGPVLPALVSKAAVPPKSGIEGSF